RERERRQAAKDGQEDASRSSRRLDRHALLQRRACSVLATNGGERSGMRVGAEPGLSRFVPWVVVLGMLAVLLGSPLWARQQDTAGRAAEARAEAAEGRAVVAEGSLTAIARSSAAATATALAASNLPEAALRRALDLVFEAYKDPTEGKLRAMSD